MTRHARLAFGFLLFNAAAAIPGLAQQYVLSTLAGGGAPPAAPAPGLSVPIRAPQGIAADAAGNVYFGNLDSVYKLDPHGILTRIAGSFKVGYSGDGGPATSAHLSRPQGLAVDGAGNLFIADSYNHSIRKVFPSGIIATVAGTGVSGSAGDGGPATSAQLSYPQGLAVDGSGNLFIAGGNRIRKVSPSGIITTVAGNGVSGVSGDGGPATSATLFYPRGLAVDSSGSLFVADGSRVRRVSPGGIITTVAGNGTVCSPSAPCPPPPAGDGGPATSVRLDAWSVTVDDVGNLFIVEFMYSRVRKVSPGGIITTVAGKGTQGFAGDGGPATSAQFLNPTGVAVDGAGNLFISDNLNQRIRAISRDGIINTVAGTGYGQSCCYSGDGGPSGNAQLNAPWGVAVDSAGNVFIGDSGNGRVRKVSTEGIITTVAGGGNAYPGDGGPATSAQLSSPGGLAMDGAGNLFIADLSDNRVRKVSPDGIITTVAGTGIDGYSGDGGPATSAQLNVPIGVAVDSAGNLFIAENGDQHIRKVSPNGIITTVAGNGAEGYSGDGGLATSAQLDSVTGVAVDGAGNLFIADNYNSRVRKVSPAGIITTVAGGGEASPGDGGPATSAALSPVGIAVDGSGNLLIAGFSIREVSPSGNITTLAANASVDSSGKPVIRDAVGIAVDGAGNVYFADGAYSDCYCDFEFDVRVLRPGNGSVVIGAVVDAASQRANPISPGEIVVIYGAGLGPSQLIQNQTSNGRFSAAAGGTVVSFNGIAAPLLYDSATQLAAVVPYAISGAMAQVTVAYQGTTSAAFNVPVALSTPSLFTSNQTGSGQAAAVNSDATVNSAVSPVKIGATLSLYATGAGQTAPGAVDGVLGGGVPILPLGVTVGGIPAKVQYAGGAPGQVSGLVQINVQIPSGVRPGGYVPVVLQLGDASTTPDAVWIAVSGN
jgi:uncharacterized protein (TIGR03437 family)